MRQVDRQQAPARIERDVQIIDELGGESLPVKADERLLNRALTALLDNAVRYTRDGKRIWMKGEKDGDSAWIRIEDEGIGIDPDQLHWIFEKFYEKGDINHHTSGRLEFGSRGMGLGLSLSRAVLEAHGGHIEVESHPGRGSTFSIRVPLTDGIQALETEADSTTEAVLAAVEWSEEIS
jgi:two-component system phosphate regulon sensor histidine kinase PhoR